MKKFSIMTLLLLLAIVALAVSLFLTRQELAEKKLQLTGLRQEMRFLDIEDESRVHAVSIPGFGRKAWRWRIHLPENRKYRLRAAYDDVPANGLPENPPDRMECELPAGESILSASIRKDSSSDLWGLVLFSESDGKQNFDFTPDINGKNTAWLAKRGGCSQRIAGNSITQVGEDGEPFILLSYRDGLSPRPGVTATNPNPTDGIVLWIEEVK